MGTSHHGGANPPNPELEALMKRFIEQTEGRARREYTRGRLGADDDGTLAMAVRADPATGTVVIDFGKPVEWIGLSPQDVAGLVRLLIGKAREVAKEPFTVEL